MMGSNAPPQPPQVAALGMLAELVALYKTAEPTLAAHLDELKQAETRITAMTTELKKGEEAHAAVAAALAEQDRKVKALHVDLAKREAACKESVAATARKQATFDDQACALDARSAALDVRQNVTERAQADGAAKLREDRITTNAEIARAKEGLERARVANEAAMQIERDKVALQIRDMRAKADAEIAAARAALDDDREKFAAREKALHERAAQLRAALGS